MNVVAKDQSKPRLTPYDLFLRISKKPEFAQILPHRINNLSSVIRLNSETRRTLRFMQFCKLWIGVCTLLFLLCFICGLHTVEGFTKFWFLWSTNTDNEDLANKLCTLEIPSTLRNVFMPPVDCNMCHNLKKIERKKNLSPEQFEKNSTHVDDDVDCQFFSYGTEFETLEEVFNMSSERVLMTEGYKPWYIGWSNCNPLVANILRKHYEQPYFLPHTSESSKLDWIFIGVPGYGADMHIDHVEYPSWQAQIRGQKLWTIEPVPECYSKCSTLQVTVKPGEILVLDTNRWYHKTVVVGKEISITIGSEYD
ncbi:uncharacterized protein LOC106467980 isoform X2 [Limulus polyphemus]|uniref:Uncharacterized protein LOC106467980 isoform X2 n=1 Tax=Limulus polyphemus TaxID=6850 RepID=A0ABM1T7T8_LIMPO|nr:uncharacterized protein LOC106467980 isoform X2 [Limulus polyphemus]